MASDFSYDVVSKVDMTEVKNSIDQAEKEVSNRYDFKNTKTSFALEEETIKVISDSEYHLELVLDILRSKFAKRGVSLKSLEYGKIEQASQGTVRQVVTLRQGIPIDEAKKLAKQIKESGIKVQATIQGDALRITAKDKDALQSAQKLILSQPDLPYDVAFENYR